MQRVRNRPECVEQDVMHRSVDEAVLDGQRRSGNWAERPNPVVWDVRGEQGFIPLLGA